MGLRSRLLRTWRFLVWLLLAELLTYGVLHTAVLGYRTLSWRHFNNRAAAPGQPVPADIPYAGLINQAAGAAGVNPELVAGVIFAESSFNPQAVSPTGARGLMQVMPATWRQINSEIHATGGRSDEACYFDPAVNIRIGTAYLSRLLERYKGNAVQALAAYNAGPQAVDDYGGVPPYDETRQYLARIARYSSELRQEPFTWPGDDLNAFWPPLHLLTGATLLLLVCQGRQLRNRHKSWRWY